MKLFTKSFILSSLLLGFSSTALYADDIKGHSFLVGLNYSYDSSAFSMFNVDIFGTSTNKIGVVGGYQYTGQGGGLFEVQLGLNYASSGKDIGTATTFDFNGFALDVNLHGGYYFAFTENIGLAIKTGIGITESISSSSSMIGTTSIDTNVNDLLLSWRIGLDLNLYRASIAFYYGLPLIHLMSIENSDPVLLTFGNAIVNGLATSGDWTAMQFNVQVGYRF